MNMYHTMARFDASTMAIQIDAMEIPHPAKWTMQDMVLLVFE